jgi:undecaprenyl-diphosphatase
VQIELWQAALLGVVQGLTEFLPVSSAGHLILVPALLGWGDSPLTRLEFTVALHLGTLLALLGVFWRDWLRLVRAFLLALGRRSFADPDARLAILIALGTIPGALAGAAFAKTIEATLRSPVIVGVMMVSVGLLLWAADHWSTRLHDETSLRAPGALAIGVAQAIAIIPGVSRSGITIATGLLLGLTRPAAARFSFLLSAPIIIGAGLKEGWDVAKAGGLAVADPIAYAVGIAAAAISGFMAIRWLLRYLGRGSLAPFVVYRIAVGLAVIALAVSGRFNT